MYLLEYLILYKILSFNHEVIIFLKFQLKINFRNLKSKMHFITNQLEASKPKYINSIIDTIVVNSLRLGALQL